MGALFVSKMSAALIVPIAAVLVGARVWAGDPLVVSWGSRSRRWTGRPRLAALLSGVALGHVAIVAGIVWAAFGFRYSAFADHDPRNRLSGTWEYILSGEPPAAVPRGVAYLRTHHLLPEAYLYGFAHTWKFTRQRSAFLNGKFSLSGWRGFFPYTALVKTPLPVFALLALPQRRPLPGRWRERRQSQAWTPIRRLARHSFYSCLPLWTLLAGYWVAAIGSHLNIGNRHLLPVYPPMFVLLGAAASWWGRRAFGMVLTGLLALTVGEAVWFFPNYLSYFNVLAGGPDHAYRHLRKAPWIGDRTSLPSSGTTKAAGFPSRGTSLWLTPWPTVRPTIISRPNCSVP